ncbi:MAG TPA: lysophospholipid acyltransferase family protein [Bacteroidales bacterium]|nr:lysophospholipid acyltransferase family protein [Bacteroidales bacterium]
MVKARHNALVIKLVGAFLFALMKVVFRKITIKGDFEDRKQALLLIGNHFSWWDGFIGLYLSKKVLKRKLYVMMLEEQLQNRKVLNLMGAFSIKKNSRSAIVSLDYASELLCGKENALLLFPQGKFQPMSQYPLTFENGWTRIISKAQCGFQIIFMVCLADFFSHPRPELTIFFKEFTLANPRDLTIFEKAYNEFLHECIQQQKEIA